MFSSSGLGFSIIICCEKNYLKKNLLYYILKKAFENTAFKSKFKSDNFKSSNKSIFIIIFYNFFFIYIKMP